MFLNEITAVFKPPLTSRDVYGRIVVDICP
jgi:hypothetical protein